MLEAVSYQCVRIPARRQSITAPEETVANSANAPMAQEAMKEEELRVEIGLASGVQVT